MNLIPDPFENVWADKNGIGGDDDPANFPTKEQADKILRDLGYDPVAVGFRGKVFAEVCIQTLKLQDELAQARARIAQLEQDIALLVSRQWVSVETRLPDNDDPVIVTDEIGQNVAIGWLVHNVDAGYWTWRGPINRVCYWMPYHAPEVDHD